MLVSPTIGSFSVLVGTSSVERTRYEESSKRAVSRSLSVVAVAGDAREGDLAGDPVVEGADAGRSGLARILLAPVVGMNENGTP